MKLSFRWYGEDDKVTLEQIRQIPGMEAIVTAVYDVPVGEVWSRGEHLRLKSLTQEAGLKFEVIESVPVHEDIKLGKPSRRSTSRITVKTSAGWRRPGSSASATTLCRCSTGPAPSWTTCCPTGLPPWCTTRSRWTRWTP